MVEEENKKEDTSEEKGDEPKVITDLDRADQIAERQKRENDRREKLLEREEALEARKTIGGTAEVSKPVEEKKLDPIEYSKEVMAGRVPDESKGKE